ncbi:hypothetical protein JCM8547_001199 [Rhodosporidiobolus lusitaniae]
MAKELLELLPLSALPHNLSSLAQLSSRVVFVSHGELPEGIQWVPSACRVLALFCFVPILALSVVDVVGWAFFKLVLRPLGYTSTARFKDPEPPSMLVPAPGAVDASGSKIEHSSSGSDALQLSTASSASSSSGPSSSGASDTSSSAPSSPETTNTLSLHDAPPSSSSAPPSRLKSRSGRSHSSTSALAFTPAHSKSPSLASTSDDAFTRRMSRDRAPSVGLDGPLFDGDGTDGAVTPGAEDSNGEGEAGDYVEARRGVPGYLRVTEARQRVASAGDEEGE